MKPSTPAQSKQARIASIVMLVTMILWMVLQWLGGQMGWAVRYAFLFDFAALAAFAWALIVLFQVWRARQ
ncbi:hypothetical protein GCM10007939_10620 [Amylibacter marinus]|uniref:DUF5337 domain-containing protein n=1 Tax=Amylibacter marinus TaxID=1475483 RepID=A0ABQ5VTX1_9RHOB|nr:DUF5337 family protein [Amylibacter marinus]GLQ34779.1 hypothetical protein GCM10007939_10620 [Amylibacter marinus]